MQLQYDTQEDLNSEVPEDKRDLYVEFKDGDKTLFMHKELAETKKEAYRYKGDLTHVQRTAQEKTDRLQALELAEKERQELLEEKELASKKEKGQYDEILEHQKNSYEKKLADITAEKEQLINEARKGKKEALVTKLSSVGTNDTRDILKRLIESDLTFNEDGGFIVLENGKASSISVEEYASKLKDLYPALVGESHGKGGSSKGADSGSGLRTKKPSEMSSQERIEFKQRDPLGFKQAFNL